LIVSVWANEEKLKPVNKTTPKASTRLNNLME
jgi:hypothetical protein